MRKAWLKYVEVARINLRSTWAYFWDQLLSTFHLVIIMFVFVQLWKVTYASSPSQAFAGFSLQEMIWYLVGTETMIMSLPRIHTTLQNEVKDGDLAVRLNKPYNYLLFHYSSFFGTALTRLATALLVGGTTAYVLVGGFHFRWESIPVLVVIYLSTQLLHFFYNASIGLLAFWIEDVSGPFLLFERLKWILGGFLLPVEVYPDAARRVVEVLPFQYMIAGPAKLLVKFSWAGAAQLIQKQVIWLAVFGLICTAMYRFGVRKVDVNGG